jgi:anti-anti-sigma regulatory factor
MAVLPRHSAPTRSAYQLTVVRVQEDRVSIRAAGELGLAAQEDLSRLLASELAAGHVFVRMDLSGVTSLDGSCLGTLKLAHDGCLASHGLLLLEGTGNGSGGIFAAARLDRRLFLARTNGPAEWLPDISTLAELARHECV